MKYNPPTQTVWYVCVALGAIALISALITIPVLTDIAVWIALVGLGLMLAASRLPNL